MDQLCFAPVFFSVLLPVFGASQGLGIQGSKEKLKKVAWQDCVTCVLGLWFFSPLISPISSVHIHFLITVFSFCVCVRVCVCVCVCVRVRACVRVCDKSH